MSPIIAPEDIPALLAAFPTPLPTPEQPSLVRSYSGNHHKASPAVLVNFERLLDAEEKRIRRSDLAERLGVQSAEWIFDCYDRDVYWSRDGRWIVPVEEVWRVREELLGRAREGFVVLDEFLKGVDLGSGFGDELGGNLCRVDCGKVVYVGEESVVRRMEDETRKAINGPLDEKVDLMALLPHVPRDVVFELAKTCVVDGQGSIDGADDQVIFIPSAYQAIRREREASDREARVDGLLQTLEAKGFMEVSKTTKSDVEEAKQRYKLRHGDDDGLETLPSEDSLIIVVPARLEAELLEMRANVVAHLRSSSSPKSETIDGALYTELLSRSSNPEMAKLVLLTSQKSEIESTLAESIREHKRQVFDDMFHRHLLNPLELYVMGLEAIQDDALQQRLESYILEYFKNEALVHFDRLVREQELLSADKSRNKDLEKFIQLTKSAANLTDFEAAISKFAKKSKIPPPSAEQLSSTKQAILNQKVKAMTSMPRASDVLQNVTWILLAEKRDGLFMSSGKDTSRMIKQYLRVSDGENAARLEGWRDAVKKSEQSDGDVKDMIDLASNSVRAITEGMKAG